MVQLLLGVSTPGTTKANSELTRQMRPYIGLAAMHRTDLKECANKRFVDTKYLSRKTMYYGKICVGSSLL